jgi:fibro-slime domain-containing protein
VNDVLEFEASGIPKPVWASFGPDNDASCPAAADGYTCRANTGKDNFDQWYRNINAVNRAVTRTMVLDHDPASDTFIFDSAAFFPIDDAGSDVLDLTYLESDYLDSCSVETGLCRNADPNTVKFCEHPSQANCTHNYLFTTEFHTFFQYQGNELFSFKGDDDVWVFVNNRLEADIGGLHIPLSVEIQLNNLTYSTLVVGETYALDLYHAERHTTGSNFRIQTNLEEACNVRSSGSSVFTLDDNSAGFDFSGAVTKEEIDDFFVLTNTAFTVNQGIRLLDSNANARGSTGYMWTNTVQNVGQGFTVDFRFLAISGDNDGFAFVVQNEGIDGLNGGTGRNLAFGGVANSVAVSFDFCASRGSRACDSEEVAIVYTDENGMRTKLAELPLDGHELANGAQHSVRIEYLGNPDWMQVYIDDQLTLLARDVDLTAKVGSLAAFLGFTASTSDVSWATPPTLILLSWTLKIVGISAERSCIQNTTTLTCLPSLPSQEVVSVVGAVVFTVQARDVCGENVNYGGSEDLITAELVLVPEVGGRRGMRADRRVLQEADANAEVTVTDTGNGTYSVSVVPTVPDGGTYTLVVKILGEDIVGSPFESVVEADVYIPPTPAPVASNDIGGIPLYGFGILMGLFAIIAGVSLYGLSRLKRYRDKWREGKEYVERGEMRRYAPDNLVLNPMIDKKIHDLERRLKKAQDEYDGLANQNEEDSIMERSESQKGVLLEEIRILKNDIDNEVASAPKKKTKKGKKKKAFEPTHMQKPSLFN